MIRILIAAVAVVVFATIPARLWADVIADEAAVKMHIQALHDDDNSVREAAAEALREIIAKYPGGTSNLRDKDAGESLWRARVGRATIGMNQAQIEELLPRSQDDNEASMLGSGISKVEDYRLDAHWKVRVYTDNQSGLISPPELQKQEYLVTVKATKQFTGAWCCWYINGQIGREIEYQDGRYHGTFTAYYDNGRKTYQQHYVHQVIDGPDTGWYPDGTLSYKGQYVNGKQDGNWTHWYSTGVKQAEENYIAGVRDGLDASWYRNGHMSFEEHYKNGIRHGVEAAWNEAGELQYKREYRDGKLVE